MFGSWLYVTCCIAMGVGRGGALAPMDIQIWNFPTNFLQKRLFSEFRLFDWLK